MSNWKVGDEALTSYWGRCIVVAIHGEYVWVTTADSMYTALLTELKRHPKPKSKRTVVVREWANRHASQPAFWLQTSVDGYHFGGSPTGRTHEFEVDDK